MKVIALESFSGPELSLRRKAEADIGRELAESLARHGLVKIIKETTIPIAVKIDTGEEKKEEKTTATKAKGRTKKKK